MVGMYKNLNVEGLGVSGRQGELIELTLTHGFLGFDFDLVDLVKKSQAQGPEQAKRLLTSAKIKIGGFELPVRWRGDEAEYRADLAELPAVTEAAATLGATRCYTTVLPANDDFPYHENFELHRKRLSEMAELLAPRGIHLGLGFLATASHREGRTFQFIHQPEALLLLLQTIHAPNVGLALDTWHWFVGGGTLDQIRELPVQQLVTVRLADLPADVEVAEATDSQRVLPGEGQGIDQAALIAHLASIEYDGPITAYPHPNCFTGLKRDAVAQKTSAALDALWTAAGVEKAGRLMLSV